MHGVWSCLPLTETVSVETVNVRDRSDRSGNSPLHNAVLAGDRGLPCLQRLCEVSKGMDLKPDSLLDQEGKSPLQLALDKGMDSHALRLITIGCSPFALVSGRRAPSKEPPSQLALIIYAARHGRESRANTPGLRPLENLLYWAILKDRPKAIQMLLNYGATRYKSVLNQDIMYKQVGSPETVLRLLARYSLPQKAAIDLSRFFGPDLEV